MYCVVSGKRPNFRFLVVDSIRLCSLSHHIWQYHHHYLTTTTTTLSPNLLLLLLLLQKQKQKNLYHKMNFHDFKGTGSNVASTHVNCSFCGAFGLFSKYRYLPNSFFEELTRNHVNGFFSFANPRNLSSACESPPLSVIVYVTKSTVTPWMTPLSSRPST